MCMEKLALLIQSKVDNGMWKPIHVSKGGPALSHLLFADDVLLFCEASVQQVQVVMSTLDHFCQASGLKVNVTKSKAMCSKRIPDGMKRQLEESSSIRFVANLGNYLGFPLVQGRCTRDTYKYLIEKLHRRLAGWKGNLLNNAGRVCLARSVTTAMPIYTMQIHHLPQYIGDNFDKITKSFIWGGDGVKRKWNKVKWATVTCPKKNGGLAIREARLSNLALLGKLVWSLLHDNNKLWVQVLSHKYLGNNSIWSANNGTNTSTTWKGILKAMETFTDGFKYRIGDGSSSFWFSDWTHMGRLCHLVDFVNISDTQLSLKDVWDAGTWNLNILMTILNREIQLFLQQNPPPTVLVEGVQDSWVWLANNSGSYTCNSGYNWLLEKNRSLNNGVDWNWIWKLKAPAKIQHFVWLCLHDAIATNKLRYKCNMSPTDVCPRCSNATEDIIHCLRDCSKSQAIWKKLGFCNDPSFNGIHEVSTWLKRMCNSNSVMIFLTTILWIWRWRCNEILGDGTWNHYTVMRMITNYYNTMLSAYGKSCKNDVLRLAAKWRPPLPGSLKLNVDGSVNSNGEMGSGGLVRNDKGDWVLGFSSKEGLGDVLFAELFGVYHGINLLAQLNCINVICETDSQEVVNLLQHRGNHTLHAYASLLNKIISMIDALPGFTIKHVFRETNCCADFLAKLGNKSSLGVSTWSHPPPGLDSLLQDDLLNS